MGDPYPNLIGLPTHTNRAETSGQEAGRCSAPSHRGRSATPSRSPSPPAASTWRPLTAMSRVSRRQKTRPGSKPPDGYESARGPQHPVTNQSLGLGDLCDTCYTSLMKHVTIRDIRHRWPETEKALEIEGEIVITRDARPIAKLVRITTPKAVRPRFAPAVHARWQEKLSAKGATRWVDRALAESRADPSAATQGRRAKRARQ